MQPAAHPGFAEVDRLHPERRLGGHAVRLRHRRLLGSKAVVICESCSRAVMNRAVGQLSAADRVRRRCSRGVAVVAAGSGAPPASSRSTEIVPGARTVLLDGLADPDGTAALVTSWAPPAAGRRRRAPARDRSGRVRRTRPDRRRRALVRLGAVRGRPPRRRRAAGRVLRLRARVRVPVRAAGGVVGAPAGHAARLGAGRLGRARRPVRRHLSDALAGRMAARRSYRRVAVRRATATRPRCSRRAPASGWRARDRGRARGRADHGAGPRPARVRPPRRAAFRCARPARAAAGQRAGRQPRRAPPYWRPR